MQAIENTFLIMSSCAGIKTWIDAGFDAPGSVLIQMVRNQTGIQ